METYGPDRPCPMPGCPVCRPLRGTPERDAELRLMGQIEDEFYSKAERRFTGGDWRKS